MAFAQNSARDQREANRDRGEVWKDWADVGRLENLMMRFDDARARRDGDALTRIDAELQQLVRSELRADKAKVKEEARDVRRDERGKVREDHRENRENMRR